MNGESIEYLAQDVEQKGVDVVVERLMIEEEFGEEAQTLAVDLRVRSVHFEDGQLTRLRRTGSPQVGGPSSRNPKSKPGKKVL